MYIDVISIFPEVIESYTNISILKRAKERGLLSVNSVNLRDFSSDKFHHVDDTPYGGGAGMVFTCDPCFKAIESCLKKETYNLKPKEKLAMTTFAASMTGCAATFVGLGLFVAGEVSLLKVANGYFKDHPYSEIKVAISPSSVGLTLGF